MEAGAVQPRTRKNSGIPGVNDAVMAILWIILLEIHIGPAVFGKVVNLQKKVDPGLLQPFNYLKE